MMDSPPCVTLSGRLVDLANPAPDQIFPLDIAHALGNMCVLGGHTNRFYSVAEHALNVAALLPPEQRLTGLLMFAPAAYLPAFGWDVPTPVAGMDTSHKLLLEAIHARFDLPSVLPPSPEILAAVAMVRHAILRDLFSRHPFQNAYPIPPRFLHLGTGLSSEAARLGYLEKLQHHGGDTARRQPMWTGRLVPLSNEKAPA